MKRKYNSTNSINTIIPKHKSVIQFIMNEDDLMWRHTYLQHAFPAGSVHQTTHRQYFLRHCSALSETVAYHITTNFCYNFGQHCSSSADDRTWTCESPADAVQDLVIMNGSQHTKPWCLSTNWMLFISSKHSTVALFLLSIPTHKHSGNCAVVKKHAIWAKDHWSPL